MTRSAAAALLVTACAAALGPAAAGVDIRLPREARFAIGQRFDVRVEASPAPARIDLTVGGRAVSLPEPDGAGGATARALTLDRPGPHEVVATAVGADGAPLGTIRTTVTAVGTAGAPGSRPVKNVILLVGDGMGAAHRTAARIVRHGVVEGRAQGRLAMDDLPGIALVTTHSLNSIVTDSAPGMTAYSTGSKGVNNSLGVFPDNTPPGLVDGTPAFDNPRVEYLGAFLHRTQGKAVGIVTTADVMDATPAGMVAHASNRSAGTGIVDQFLDEGARQGLVVLMGGGRRWFLPRIPGTRNGSSRAPATDYALPADALRGWDAPDGALDPGRDLLAEFRAQGFVYAATRQELEAPALLDPPQGPKPTKLLGLFALGNLNAALDKVAERRAPERTGVVDMYHEPDQPMLDEMTRAALTVLARAPQGFVLLVEGALIDKQSHQMDAERTVWETLEFDRAIAVAREFAEKAGDTLVIVTADHETAGFSLIGGSIYPTAKLKELAPEERLKAVGTHEQAGFPRYAIARDGYPEIVDPDGKLLVGYGAGGDRHEDWLAEENPVVEMLNPDELKAELKEKGMPFLPAERSPERERGMFVPAQAPYYGLAAHTASDIVLSAYSSGSDAWRAFTGVLDNTDVFFRIVQAVHGGAAGPR